MPSRNKSKQHGRGWNPSPTLACDKRYNSRFYKIIVGAIAKMRDVEDAVPYEGFAITLSFRAERSVVEKSQPRMRSLHFGRDDRMWFLRQRGASKIAALYGDFRIGDGVPSFAMRSFFHYTPAFVHFQALNNKYPPA